VELGQSLSAEEHVSTTVEPRRRGAGTACPDEEVSFCRASQAPHRSGRQADARRPPPLAL